MSLKTQTPKRKDFSMENINEEELDLMKKNIESMDEEEFNAVFKRNISLEEAQSSTIDVYPDPNIPIDIYTQWVNEGLEDTEFGG